MVFSSWDGTQIENGGVGVRWGLVWLEIEGASPY